MHSDEKRNKASVIFCTCFFISKLFYQIEQWYSNGKESAFAPIKFAPKIVQFITGKRKNGKRKAEKRRNGETEKRRNSETVNRNDELKQKWKIDISEFMIK